MTKEGKPDNLSIIRGILEEKNPSLDLLA